MKTASYLLVCACLVGLVFGCGEAEKRSDSEGTPAVGDHMAYQDSIILELAGEDSVTVLQLLQRDHTVHALTTAGGAFVEGIDEIGDNGEHFWIYTVNDTAPPVACDKYITTAGEQIKWHFRRVGE